MTYMLHKIARDLILGLFFVTGSLLRPIMTQVHFPSHFNLHKLQSYANLWVEKGKKYTNPEDHRGLLVQYLLLLHYSVEIDPKNPMSRS